MGQTETAKVKTAKDLAMLQDLQQLLKNNRKKTIPPRSQVGRATAETGGRIGLDSITPTNGEDAEDGMGHIFLGDAYFGDAALEQAKIVRHNSHANAVQDSQPTETHDRQETGSGLFGGSAWRWWAIAAFIVASWILTAVLAVAVIHQYAGPPHVSPTNDGTLTAPRQTAPTTDRQVLLTTH